MRHFILPVTAFAAALWAASVAPAGAKFPAGLAAVAAFCVLHVTMNRRAKARKARKQEAGGSHARPFAYTAPVKSRTRP